MAEAEEDEVQTIHGLVEHVATARGEDAAIYHGTEVATFGELDTQASSRCPISCSRAAAQATLLARKLRRMGVSAGGSPPTPVLPSPVHKHRL